MRATAPLSSDLGGYVERVAKLFRLDAALLSLETKQNLQSLGVSVALFAAAGAFAVLGLIILLVAAVLLLIQLGLAPSLSALIVAVALFVIAGVLALVGLQRIKHWTLTPRRTINQFKRNLEALQASLRHEPNPNT